MDLYDVAVARKLSSGGGGGGGSSDFSTATVTITMPAVPYDAILIPFLTIEDDELMNQQTISPTEPTTISLEVVLYKGYCAGTLSYEDAGTDITNLSATGDISVDVNGYIEITGNGTITIS